MIRLSQVVRTVRALGARSVGARTLLTVVLAGAFASACDVHGVTDPGNLYRIAVTPNASISALSTQQMIAIGYDGDGRVIPLNPTWTASAGGSGFGRGRQHGTRDPYA